MVHPPDDDRMTGAFNRTDRYAKENAPRISASVPNTATTVRIRTITLPIATFPDSSACPPPAAVDRVRPSVRTSALRGSSFTRISVRRVMQHSAYLMVCDADGPTSRFKMKPKLWRYALQVVAEADGEIRHRDIRQRVLADQQSDSSPRTVAEVWKLALEAEKTWRRLMGFKLDRGARN